MGSIAERVTTNSRRADQWLTPGSHTPGWARLISEGESEYPPLLAHTRLAPETLMAVGSPLDGGRLRIAIVGARSPSRAGLSAGRQIASELARTGVVIVSGLAAGIDASAHSGAIEGGGTTIAVMGTGHNSVYPASNLSLKSKILHNGTVLSQFDYAQGPSKTTFPARNAVITGMSNALIAVEMSERSGTRVAVELAIEMGRPVLLWSPILGEQQWAQALVRRLDDVHFIDTPTAAIAHIPGWALAGG